ncbi:MAG: T9SS type A sorting domain-containing protein [Polaribacter sp.]|uniref:T9SS type A sorting domain-containing protein n=1 Tax=Polaribacter sp. TaxID=1920175 RepID=UPI003EF66C99
MKNNYAILFYTFLIAFTFSQGAYAQCSSCDAANTNSNNPNFIANEARCFTTGTRTISSDITFEGGGSICVAAGATLNLGANNYSASGSGTFTIYVEGTLNVQQNPTWAGNMDITIANGGLMTTNTLTLNGNEMNITNNGTFNPATLQFNNASAVITVENNSNMTVSNQFNINSGVAQFINSGNLIVSGNYNSNSVSSYINCGEYSGKFNLNSGSQVINTGTFTTGQIDYGSAASKVSNYGTFNITGNVNLGNGGTFYNQGVVITSGSGTFSSTGDFVGPSDSSLQGYFEFGSQSSVNAGDIGPNLNFTRTSLGSSTDDIGDLFQNSDNLVVDSNVTFGGVAPTINAMNCPDADGGVTYSGTIFNDTSDNDTVDGTGVGAPVTTQLYLNVVDENNNVIGFTTVENDATYTITLDDALVDYTFQLSTNQGTIGSPAPAIALPSGWEYRNEGFGPDASSDGVANGSLFVPSLSSGSLDFGIKETVSPCNDPAGVDTDGDGINDICDLDDDNDGVLDIDEDGCATESKIDVDVIYSEDFGTGNTRTNDSNVKNHIYKSSGSIGDGYYAVVSSNTSGLLQYNRTDNNENVDANFDGLNGPAGGSTNGRYLAINMDGNGNPNYSGPANGIFEFYRIEGLTTQVGADYRFRVDLAGLCNYCVDIPEFTLQIQDASGTVLKTTDSGDIGVLNDDIWRRVTLDFTATTTTVNIVLINSQPKGNGGNDVGVDNIVLASIGCDTDLDGIPNRLDLDSDNDGIPDIVEAGGEDTDGNGKVDDLNADGTLKNDTDNNGLDDRYDVGNGGSSLGNPDSDGDGVPNSQDLDSDNDGVADIVEAGGEDTDGNGKVDDLNADGTLKNDTDNNGLDDRYDVGNGGNSLGNPDTDGDGVPNSQDLDSDNDGITDIIEAGGTDADGNGKVDDLNADGTLKYDIDSDGFSDAVDGDVGQTGTSNNILNVLIVTGEDTDNDGKPDSYPSTDDTDGDGKLNFLDLDSDNDGIPDVTEAGGTDADNDGRADDDDDNADNTGSNGIPTSAGTGTIVPTSTDADGIPDYLDLDADNDGIPDNIEAQTTTGYVAPSGLDSDEDGLDDAYDPDCTGSNCSGVTGALIVPVNTDGADTADYIDLDSDNDGAFDVIESGSGLTNNGSGVVTGDVGSNGLVDDAETGDTDQGYSDVNGEYDNTQTDNFTDTDEDVLTIGNVDYRDTELNGTPMITQVYQFGAERWIEITNIGDYDISANSIKVQFYKDLTGSQTGVVPGATYTVGTILEAGKSVLFKNSNNSIINSTEIVSDATSVVNDNLTDFFGGDDMITLSTTNDATSYENRYDVVQSFADNTSYVRIDETLVPNKDYEADEWVIFIDDAIESYSNPSDTDPNNERHAHAPLISEIKNANTEANIRLGLHRIKLTDRITKSGTSVWSNGYPDRSRNVKVSEDYNHNDNVLNKLSARKLEVRNGSTLSVTDNLLVVTNNIVIATANDEIRLISSDDTNLAQLIQTHTTASQVTGDGKLLIDQNSTIPSRYRYNYLSSPVNTIGATTYSIEDVLKDGTTPLSATSAITDITFVAGYDGDYTKSPIEIADYWIYNYTASSDGRSNWNHMYKSGDIKQTDGFIFKGPGSLNQSTNGQNYTFVGTPKDGTLKTTIGAGESYLLGNPYASAISAKKFIEDNLDTNTGSLYFWEHEQSVLGDNDIRGHYYGGYIGGYGVRNLSMGTAANNVSINADDPNDGAPSLGSGSYTAPEAFIAIGQGFFIEGDDAASIGVDNIKFNNSQREYIQEGTNSHFFKSENKESSTKTTTYQNTLPIIKLGMDYVNDDNLGLHRQLGISFKNNNSFEFDKGYDTGIFDIGTTDLYWKFPGDDSKYVIAGVQSVSDDLEVPLELLMSKNGEVTFGIDEWNAINKNVYIIDKLTNTSYNITDGKVTVAIEKGIYSDRFVLAFREIGVLGLEGNVWSNGLHIYSDNKNHSIVISKNLDLNLHKVELFDILGKKVSFWNINEQKTSYQLEIKKQIPTGIYIVKINTDNGIINKKVVVE